MILQWIVAFFSGVFGRNAYYISIPVLILLIWLQLASRGQPVRGRSFSFCAFVLLFGCMSHLIAKPEMTSTGLERIAELYTTGITGASGGVFCGLVTDVLTVGFGRFFSFCTLLILLVLSLMYGAHLNIRGFIRSGVTLIQEKIEEFRTRENEDYDYQPEDEEDDDPGFMTRMIDNIAEKFSDRRSRKRLESAKPSLRERTAQMIHNIAPEFDEDFEDVTYEPAPVDALPLEPVIIPEPASEPVPEPANRKVTAQETAMEAMQVEQEIAAAQAAPKPEYNFPPIELLQRPRGRAADGTAEMKENTVRLNESLASYKIDAHISNVTRGPSVTRYEVELEKGVRLNKLTSCADDIALSLGASGVRIAPVPGKISVVGIEVPNQSVTNVSLREVIDSAEFRSAKSHSSIAVGKDIGGKCIVGNIAKFPHMLIAGTTGSGKSVCMNSIIISLLYKASPEDVKLIMVDPKMVELGIYNGIPHLLIPVVTDPKKAAGSLQWAVTEMMRRYRSMSDAGVRDLESYNSMIEGGEVEGEKLPQVVVIIDELADLMLVAAKEVEESICRIAQMGRAAGIHLIIATQRPSADVITGLMKANIPSRIAFSVASAMESRIILDTVGAEKLVGRGDMLYSPIGSGKPQRVQGCFVTDAEVEAVASYVKEHFSSTYDQSVMEDIERKAEQTGSKGGAHATASDPDPIAEELAHDEMLPDAVDVILETKQASVSLLQRRLKLGYARAARIVDEMEEMGIVGPFVGSKPRQILVTKEQWEQMKQGQTIVTQAPEPVPDEIDIPF
ncbi:MAG: DNA translocase FtsK [Oscillospiraceae bacterium]|nr:DNA translocase FtsK [Oscillospiraceae bacterium]